jgi:glucokinase
MRALRRFVIVWGLPGSGKSTLARLFSPGLQLPVIDKDDILESLSGAKGVGDTVWRRTLSRESDLAFQRQAAGASGAVLVSHWRMPGMPADSGTPLDWLPGLSNHFVNLHCACPPEIAASRFRNRKRHPGHLDCLTSEPQLLADLRQLASLELPPIGRRVVVNTTEPFSVKQIVHDVLAAFNPRT